VVAERLEEGFGETVFELGFEHNGDSMNLQLDEWNRAYDRLVEAAKKVQGSSQLLITHNVGGDKELATAPAKAAKAKGCNGKVLLRKIPSRIEDVIETRIAVVGNGTCWHRPTYRQQR
jgi:GTPase